MRKRKVAIVIIIILILTLFFSIALINNESFVTSIKKTFYKAYTLGTGTTGTCKWTLDSNGLLIIEPTNGVSGTMGDYPSTRSTSFYRYASDVRTIRFTGTVYAPTDSVSLFEGLTNLYNFDSTNFDTSTTTNIAQMFADCRNITNLDLSNFDTSHVTSMEMMFNGCYDLSNLDISNFNTSNVTSMASMFSYCQSLTNVDLSSFDTSHVTSMVTMFLNCESLTNIDVRHFNTDSLQNMHQMFMECDSLISLDLSSFGGTSDIWSTYELCYGCDSLVSADISGLDTNLLPNYSNLMANLFRYCDNLVSLTLGPNFVFKTTTVLQSYDSPWRKIGTTAPTYTSAELMNLYDGATMAGTWVRYTTAPISITIKKDDQIWQNNNVKVALYQNGVEKYPYNDATVSTSEGTITWNDVAPGTYDIYSSKDSDHTTQMVDTGMDVFN